MTEGGRLTQEVGMRHTVGLIVTLVLGLLAAPLFAEAQQPADIPRIGYLDANPLSGDTARMEAFQQGLRELGYVEGKNIVIVRRENAIAYPRSRRS